MAIPKASTAVVDSNLDAYQTTNFKVKITGKTFKILLDGIYTEKILAVVRELASNAYDAHIASGNTDQPFEIQLPSLLDPVFRIRDYGESMTHDFMMDLYTTLFHSSKEETNEQMGQKGLGSKTPYAYTDSFTVVAYLNGEKRVYLASMDSKEIPEFAHLYTEPSDEPTGLEVTVPVQAKDFFAFAEATSRVMMGFDFPPIISGAEINVPKPMFEHDNWKIYQGQSNSIRQGCVVYPFTNYQLKLHTGINHGLMVDVPIGTVEPAANRESLSFDDETIQAVKDAFADAKISIQNYINEDIQSAPTRLQAEKLAHAWRQTYQGLTAKIDYRGRPLTGKVEFKKGRKDFPPLRRPNEDYLIKDVFFSVHSLERAAFIIERPQQKVLRRKMRIKKYVKDTANKHGYGGVLVLVDPTSQQLASLVRRLELRPDQLIPASTLPDIPPKTSTGTGTGTPKKGIYTASDNKWSNTVTIYSDPLPDEYYWAVTEKGVASAWVDLDGLFSTTMERVQKEVNSIFSELEIPILPFHYMTATAKKREEPDPDFHIPEVIRRHAKLKRHLVINAATLAGFQVYIAHNSHFDLEFLAESLKDILAAEGLDIGAGSKFLKAGYWAGPHQVYKKIFGEDIDNRKKKGEEFAISLLTKYPMLSNTIGTEDVANYIKQQKDMA